MQLNRNGIQTNARKTDDTTFRAGAHTQQGFRKSILNLTGSESHPHMFAIYFS